MHRPIADNDVTIQRINVVYRLFPDHAINFDLSSPRVILVNNLQYGYPYPRTNEIACESKNESGLC